mmetsp:Transcript_8021/g.17893  ORF Transcript_8021/g.17893 Transcript_8021/m.17893 type:complete len:256 (-) Transcript_8021:1232-1999(-)
MQSALTLASQIAGALISSPPHAAGRLLELILGLFRPKWQVGSKKASHRRPPLHVSSHMDQGRPALASAALRAGPRVGAIALLLEAFGLCPHAHPRSPRLRDRQECEVREHVHLIWAVVLHMAIRNDAWIASSLSNLRQPRAELIPKGHPFGSREKRPPAGQLSNWTGPLKAVDIPLAVEYVDDALISQAAPLTNALEAGPRCLKHIAAEVALAHLPYFVQYNTSVYVVQRHCVGSCQHLMFLELIPYLPEVQDVL